MSDNSVKDFETINQETVGQSLMEFFSLLIKFRYFLFLFVFTITLVVTVIVLLSSKWYKSTSVVLPAEQTDFLGGLSGLSSLVKGVSGAKSLAGLTGSDETDRFIAILQSSTVFDDVIRKFNLRKLYDVEDTYYENVVKELQDNTEFEVMDEGQLAVSVFDKDPIRAAKMANYFVELLNKTNTVLHTQNAKANREFIEKRYLKNVEDISLLEDSMKNFQVKNGVIAVPEQLETTVTAMAAIYGQLTEREIQLGVLENTLNETHPMVSLAKTEISELKKKINAMNNGNGNGIGDINLLIPLHSAPQLAQNYIEIYRDLEIQYKILEFITPMYEQAKVEEIRSTPSVVILDKAGPAEKKSKPKGSLYALSSLVISLILGIFIIMTIELVNKLKIKYPQNFEFISTSLQNDLRKLGLKKQK